MPITRHGYAAPRGTTSQRGYGSAHQRTRIAIAQSVNAGHARCARCGKPIRVGQPWDLDHTDNRNGYLGASHATCNRGTRKNL